MRATAREYVIVDLETTGLDIERDEIIEIAVVKVCRGLIVDEWSTLVAPGIPLPAEISELTGIDAEMLIGQPTIDEVLPRFAAFVGAADLVAHNAGFDSEFLHKYWPDERIWLDTIVLAQIAWPCFASFSLFNLTTCLDIVNDNAHRALSDAQATAELLIRILTELDHLPERAKTDILRLAEGDETPTGVLLRRICGQAGAVTAEPERRSREPRGKRCGDESFYLEPEVIDDYLGAAGLCHRHFPDFEDRQPQIEMSHEVVKAFNDRSVLLAEAGTGTGKSLAYLLPAALFAAGSGFPVAISTHTRYLQEQLVNKDIPMLSELLERPIKAAVLKGRSNYLCRRLYHYYLDETPEQLRYFLMRVAVWRAASINGDGGELMLNSHELWKWRSVAASRENCVPYCPYARKNSCFVQQARLRAADADLLILNHSLLIANAVIEKGFLPPLPFLVIDEAQHLEHAAADQMTARVDLPETMNALSRITRREKGKRSGALAQLEKYVALLGDTPAQEPIRREAETLTALTEEVATAAGRFFDLLAACFDSEAARQAFLPAKLRVTAAHRQNADWPLLCQLGEELAAVMNQAAAGCFRILDLLLAGCSEEEAAQQLNGMEELQGAGATLRDLAATLQTCLQEEQDNYVVWVEVDIASARQKISLNTAPIQIDQLLNENLYANVESIVFTSATIAAGQDFKYFERRLGLDLLQEPPRHLLLASPFHYREQALTAVVTDLPDWGKCSEIEAVDAISAALIPLLAASRGRAIVLFTSHRQLRAVYQQIRQPLAERQITVLAHGVTGDPQALLHRLKREDHCCILGAASFWEGVDVIGDRLSLIVVVRLPFLPPNTPIMAARAEQIEETGRSSFAELSLPQALIRFKQGFGRLIRSDLDRGVFCVLDRRILEKRYGRSFLNCLPDMRRVCGETAEVAALIDRTLAEK